MNAAQEAESNARKRSAKGHVDEVRAFLAHSQELEGRLDQLVDRIRGQVQASDESADQAAGAPEDIAAGARDASVFLAADQELERVRSELERVRSELERARSELEHARVLLEREHVKYLDASRGDPRPTLITDRGATVRDANSAAAEALGVGQDALPGRLLIAFVARQDVRRFRDFSRPLWNELGDETRGVILRLRPRGGAVVVARLAVHCLRSSREVKVGLHWTIDALRGTAA